MGKSLVRPRALGLLSSAAVLLLTMNDLVFANAFQTRSLFQTVAGVMIQRKSLPDPGKNRFDPPTPPHLKPETPVKEKNKPRKKSTKQPSTLDPQEQTSTGSEPLEPLSLTSPSSSTTTGPSTQSFSTLTPDNFLTTVQSPVTINPNDNTVNTGNATIDELVLDARKIREQDLREGTNVLQEKAQQAEDDLVEAWSNDDYEKWSRGHLRGSVMVSVCCKIEARGVSRRNLRRIHSQRRYYSTMKAPEGRL